MKKTILVCICIVLFPHVVLGSKDVMEVMRNVCTDGEHVIVFTGRGLVEDISLVSTISTASYNIEHFKKYCRTEERILVAHCHLIDGDFSSFPSAFTEPKNKGDINSTYLLESACSDVSVETGKKMPAIEHALADLVENRLVLYGLGTVTKEHVSNLVKRTKYISLHRQNAYLSVDMKRDLKMALPVVEEYVKDYPKLTKNLNQTQASLIDIYKGALTLYKQYRCTSNDVNGDEVCNDVSIEKFSEYIMNLHPYFFIDPRPKNEEYFFE